MRNRKLKIGCAVSQDAVTAVIVGAGRDASAQVVVSVTDGDAPHAQRLATALAAAVSQLLEQSGRSSATLRIALIPPLVQVRCLSLPPMREEERTHVLARDAGRYFFGIAEPQIAASASAGADGVIAAAAPAALMHTLRDSLPENVAVDAFLPAVSAWAAASTGGTGEDIVVHIDDVEIRISRRGGRISGYRQRSLQHAADVDVATRWPGAQAAAAAAAHAWKARDLALLEPHDRQRLRQQRTRRMRMGVAAAIVMILVGAIGSHVNVSRQLAGVRAERAGLRTDLVPALADADSLLAIEQRLAEARTLASGTTWSEVLPLIAQRLHTDAHLIHVTGTRDSLALRIQARAAADVLPELRTASLFQQVRIAGAIERDVTDQGATLERFDIAAIIRRPEAQR
jgi:hypothetical protein